MHTLMGACIFTHTIYYILMLIFPCEYAFILEQNNSRHAVSSHH
jgi:hypothetical protein